MACMSMICIIHPRTKGQVPVRSVYSVTGRFNRQSSTTTKWQMRTSKGCFCYVFPSGISTCDIYSTFSSKESHLPQFAAAEARCYDVSHSPPVLIVQEKHTQFDWILDEGDFLETYWTNIKYKYWYVTMSCFKVTSIQRDNVYFTIIT